MPGCSADGCTNSTVKGFRMHRFPVDMKRRLLWAVAMDRRDQGSGKLYLPNPTSVLCEKHFDKSYFLPSGHLSYNAVPTIFDHSNKTPPTVQKTGSPRKSPKTSALEAGLHDYAFTKRKRARDESSPEREHTTDEAEHSTQHTVPESTLTAAQGLTLLGSQGGSVPAEGEPTHLATRDVADLETPESDPASAREGEARSSTEAQEVSQPPAENASGAQAEAPGSGDSLVQGSDGLQGLGPPAPYKYTIFIPKCPDYQIRPRPAPPPPKVRTPPPPKRRILPKRRASNQPAPRAPTQPAAIKFARPAGGKTIEIVVLAPNPSEGARGGVDATSSDGSGLPVVQVSLARKSERRVYDLRHRIALLQQQKKKLTQNVSDARRKSEGLRGNLGKFLTENQVEMLERNSTRGQKWTDDTMLRAVRLWSACGTSGYAELLEQGYPLPSVTTLQRHLRNTGGSPDDGAAPNNSAAPNDGAVPNDGAAPNDE